MQSRRDQAIVDAWKNGGEFQGQPVTDDRLLAYWQARLDGISTKDPQRDQYANTLLQFQYAIAQSKNELDYAQGKITDAERAQFFLDWSQKVPKDSELYRTLQKNAAQFLQAAKSKASSGASASQASARDAADQGTIASKEAAGDYLLDVLTRAAQMRGDIEAGTGTAATLDALSLTGPHGGPLDIPTLLELINRSPAVLDYLRTLDPTFSGTVTQAYLEQVTQNRVAGIQERINRAQAAGDMTGTNGVTALRKLYDAATEVARQVGAYDTAQTYESYRQAWLAVASDPTASPEVKLKAWADYARKLTALANDPMTDSITAQALLDEANLDPTAKSLHENFTRTTSIKNSVDRNGNPTGDIADTLASLQAAQADAESVATGQGVLTYGNWSGGSFTPDPTGKSVGVIPVGEAQSSGLELVVIPQPDGTTISVYAKSTPVVTVARDPVTGEPMKIVDKNGNFKDSQTQEVAQAYDVTWGGKTIRVYRYTASDGTTRYTTTPIWGAGVVETEVGGKIVLDATGAAKPTQVLGTGNKPVTVYDPVQAYDPIKENAGLNSRTDATTLVTAVASTAGGDAKAIIDAVNADPLLRQQVINAALVSLGGEVAAKDPTKLAAWQALGEVLSGSLTGYPDVDPAGYTNLNTGTFIEGSSGPKGPQAPSTTGGSAFEPLVSAMDVPGQIAKWGSVPHRAGERNSDAVPPLTVPRLPDAPDALTGSVAALGPQGNIPLGAGKLPILTPQAPPVAAPSIDPTAWITPTPPFVPPAPQNVVPYTPPAPVPSKPTSDELKNGSATRTSGGVVGF